MTGPFLPPGEEANLAALLGDLIPAAPAAGFPAANAERLVGSIATAGGRETLMALLDTLSSLAPTGYAGLDAEGRQALVATLRRKHLRLFADFFTLAIQCYCLQPQVQTLLCGSARPPFPDGYSLTDGNLELLEAVYERGPCYRPC